MCGVLCDVDECVGDDVVVEVWCDVCGCVGGVVRE